MSALAPLDADARQRLLALMGIDVYVRRAPRVKGSVKGSGSFTVARPQGNETMLPVNEPDPFTAFTGLLQVECDLADAGAQPLSGPYAALLRQVIQAIGAAPREVRFMHFVGQDDAACIRLSQGASSLQAPTLAQVRSSGAAKRSLWTALRTLRRERAQR